MAQGAIGLVQARRGRYSYAILPAHILGGVLGSAAVAWLAWIVATPLRTLVNRPVRIGVAAATALIAAGLDWRGHNPRRNMRQVPQSWLGRYGALSAYFRYGLVLGSSIGTYEPSYLVASSIIGASLLLPTFPAVAVGVSFGATRCALVGLLMPLALRIGGLGQIYGRWTRFVRRGSIIGGLCLATMLSYSMISIL